jgi:hypothetical protein
MAHYPPSNEWEFLISPETTIEVEEEAESTTSDKSPRTGLVLAEMMLSRYRRRQFLVSIKSLAKQD